MTKADFIALAGFALGVIGFGMIYKPLGFIAAGTTLVLLARALHQAKLKNKGGE